MKIHYCRICRRLKLKGFKGEKDFEGTRKQVRKHLVQDHGIRGQKNFMALTKGDFGESEISKNTGSREL